MKARNLNAVREVYDAVGRSGSRGPSGLQLATGRRLALELGYPGSDLAGVPDSILDAFIGAAPLATLVRPAPGQRILDLGCGAGLDSFLLQRSGARVVAVDPSASMLRRLQRAAGSARSPHLYTVRAEAPVLPFRSAAFDHLLLNGVANLIGERNALLREVTRLLRPGGTLLLADLVALEPLPAELLELPEAWAWCVAGASEPDCWRRQLGEHQFAEAEVVVVERFPPLARAVLRAVRSPAHSDPRGPICGGELPGRHC